MNGKEEYQAAMAKNEAETSQFKQMAGIGATQQIFSEIGYYRGVLVALKHIRKAHIQLSRNVLLELNTVCAMGCILSINL